MGGRIVHRRPPLGDEAVHEGLLHRHRGDEAAVALSAVLRVAEHSQLGDHLLPDLTSRGGEHLLLVRSLGVSQVIVAVNKLDQVEWAKSRYDEIVELLKPFLVQSGFHPSKTKFVPVAAMDGVNLARPEPVECPLYKWYKGPSLVDLLGEGGLASSQNSSN